MTLRANKDNIIEQHSDWHKPEYPFCESAVLMLTKIIGQNNRQRNAVHKDSLRSAARQQKCHNRNHQELEHQHIQKLTLTSAGISQRTSERGY